jgi:hypothetical protein
VSLAGTETVCTPSSVTTSTIVVGQFAFVFHDLDKPVC